MYALRTRLDLGGGLVGALLGALITIMIFVALAPVVADQVAGASTTNFTNGSDALFGLIPLFFVLLGVIGIVAFIRSRN